MSSLAELSARKQDYVRERIAGKNKTQAALAVGYSPKTARQAAQSIETPDVKAVFRALCARAAPMDKLAKRLAEGLDACETEFAKHEGKITDSRDTIAWSERRAYLELAAEYAGYVEKDAPAMSVQIGALSLASPVSISPSAPIEGLGGSSAPPEQPVIDVASEQASQA